MNGLRARAHGAALLVLAANALGLIAYTAPQRAAESSRELRLVSLRLDLGRAQRQLAERQARLAAQHDNAVDLERLLKSLQPRPEALVPALEALEQMARGAGLRPRQRSYAEEELPGGGIVRVGIKLPLEGRYGALVDFLGRVERSTEALSVDSVALRGDEGQARLEVGLSAWFRPAEAR